MPLWTEKFQRVAKDGRIEAVTEVHLKEQNVWPFGNEYKEVGKVRISDRDVEQYVREGCDIEKMYRDGDKLVIPKIGGGRCVLLSEPD